MIFRFFLISWFIQCQIRSKSCVSVHLCFLFFFFFLRLFVIFPASNAVQMMRVCAFVLLVFFFFFFFFFVWLFCDVFSVKWGPWVQTICAATNLFRTRFFFFIKNLFPIKFFSYQERVQTICAGTNLFRTRFFFLSKIFFLSRHEPVPYKKKFLSKMCLCCSIGSFIVAIVIFFVIFLPL